VLGYEADSIQKIREGVAILEGIGLDHFTVEQAVEVALRKQGRPTKGEQKEIGKPTSGRFSYGGNPEYIIARLKRDERVDLLDRIESGDLSPNAAAIEAGYRKRPTPLDTLQRAWRKASDDERQSFLEWLGDKGTPAIRFRV
jgi:hypothetical protein